MNIRTKKILKRTGFVLAVLLLIILSLGIYIYMHIPRPVGEPPVLQTWLFEKPARPFPVEGKYIFKTAGELAALIREKKATSVEIVTEYLNYIKNNNYKTRSFVWLFEEEALQAARQADAKVTANEPLGMLHGVPVAIKEQFWIKGKYSTINAGEFQHFIAPQTAAIVKAWLDQGAILLGTTNVPRMLIDLQTYGDLYPTGLNPYDTAYTCGGSTGGGASAVAMGFAPLSLGGDMGGSIRVPAAFCGIYGLKTTEHSTEEYGTFPDTSSDRSYVTMTVNGPQATTVEDIELAWKALIKPWYARSAWRPVDTTRPLKDYRVAWFDEWHYNDREVIPATPSLKAKMAALMESLASAGVKVTRQEPRNFAAMRQLHWLQMVYMIFNKQPWLIRQLIRRQFEGADNQTSIDLSEGTRRIGSLTTEAYQDIRMRRDTLSRAFEKFFDNYDFLIMPVTPGPAIRHNHTRAPFVEENIRYLYWDYFHYTMCTNLTGHPSLTVPLGLNADGLPVAVQIVGPLYSEEQIIQFAKLIEGLHAGYVRPRL